MTKFSVYVQLAKPEFVRVTIIRSYKNFRGVLLCVVGVASLILGIAQATGRFPSTGHGLPSLFIGLYLLVVYPLMVVFAASRSYKASTFMQQGITYIFSEEGIQLTGNKELEMSLDWSQLVKKRLYGNYLFLFTSRLNAFIIPRNELTEEELAFIGKKVPKGRL
jgi:hypothetical protein